MSRTRLPLVQVLLCCCFWVAPLKTVSAQEELNIFGYFATRFEKIYDMPTVLPDGELQREKQPGTFGYPSLNLMMEQALNDRFRVFVNIGSRNGQELSVRNFWGEYRLSRYLTGRFGKTYRKFGLYNEILDAVPTYFGIEAPELFDEDHLILSRNTTLMLHGNLDLGDGVFYYSLSTDNGEGKPQNNVIPWSYDANYRFGAGKYRMGISGYFSGGFTTPDKRPGLGTPASGVLPWMSGDRFEVFGGYVEVNKGPALLQAAYWAAHHNARRDPAAVMVLLRDAGVNSRQRARFLADPAADPAEPGNIRTAVTYQVRTWYLRLGYSHESNLGEIAPYLQCDFYENPEIIFNKLYGGDEEVGLSDEGKFTKPTLGIIFRPIPEVALKMDASAHIQTLNGAVGHYSEIRLDVSYLFGH